VKTSRLIIVAALALAACKGTFAPHVPGAGGDRIRFPHSTHKDNGVECSQCHDPLMKSTSLQGSTEGFLPKESVCMDCHQDQKDGGNCQFCHSNPDRAGDKEKRIETLRIPHATHGENGVECDKCHEQLPEIDRPAPNPKMETCMECHDESYKVGGCSKCHVDLKKYGLKPVADFSHEGGWLDRHPAAARSAPQNCAQCHEHTFCAACHAAATAPALPSTLMPERVDREFIHRGDWRSRHMIEAEADPASCRRCHGVQYCTSCHQQKNLTPGAATPHDPHPVGWSYPGSPQFHGPAARNDIASCAACHDQGGASNCVKCHKVGGIGGNPHPAGWTSKHDKAQATTNGMCRYCHAQ
jgi:hypothetical protein